jgi:hypothetical protein
MNDEKIRILKMVEEGKLSASEAAKLIEALEPSKDGGSASALAKSPGKKARFFKIRVFEGDMNKPKVNVTLPLGLMKAVTKVLPKSAKVQLEDNNIDLDALLKAVDENADTKIVEVEDDEEKTRVEIFIE